MGGKQVCGSHVIVVLMGAALWIIFLCVLQCWAIGLRKGGRSGLTHDYYPPDVHPSIYPSFQPPHPISPSIHPSTYPSLHLPNLFIPFIHPSMHHPPIHLFIHPYTYPSIHPIIHSSIYHLPSTCPWLHSPARCPSTHPPSIHLSVYNPWDIIVYRSKARILQSDFLN